MMAITVFFCILFLSAAWTEVSNGLRVRTLGMPVRRQNPPVLHSTALDAPDVSLAPAFSTGSNSEGSGGVATQIKYSETGAAMDIENVNLSIGNNDILKDISWTIMPLERWALVGKNGAGKSTLLKALTGSGGEMLNIRDGSISLSKKLRLGYLEQKGVSGSKMTVRDEVSSRMDRYRNAKAALAASDKAVEEGDISDEALTLLAEANEEFEAAGGYTVNQKISQVLGGLGFVESDFDRMCVEFSGGWQMRIALARLLLSEPDLLLLDEPTNHLDKGARDWLGKYLSKYAGTLLVVSHDEELLNMAATSIAEVRGGRVELYKSRSHDQWLFEREERVRNAQATYDATIKEIERLQGFVDRFGAKTMGAAAAQSRLKTIEKLEATLVIPPQVDDGPAPMLNLAKPPRGTKELLTMRGVTAGWRNPVNPSEFKTVIKKCDFTIERGMRIVVRGANGAGKSTLMACLSGKAAPLSGSRIEGDGLAVGTFTQDLAQDLDQSARAVDIVTTAVRVHDPALSDETARSVLGALGLRGPKALRTVGLLSGGEKARVALASFVLIPHNLLLLDEPSNHLDIGTLRVLTKALRDYEGTSMVISHDRQFLEELEPTHVITVKAGEVEIEERGLQEDDWNDPIDAHQVESEKLASAPSVSVIASPPIMFDAQHSTASVFTPAVTATASIEETSARLNDPSLSNEERKKIMNAPKRIKKIENMLERHKADSELIEKEMITNGTNRGKLSDLQAKKDKVTEKMDVLYAEYEELLLLI